MVSRKNTDVSLVQQTDNISEFLSVIKKLAQVPIHYEQGMKIKTYKTGGGAHGTMESVLASHSANPSSNPGITKVFFRDKLP